MAAAAFSSRAPEPLLWGKLRRWGISRQWSRTACNRFVSLYCVIKYVSEFIPLQEVARLKVDKLEPLRQNVAAYCEVKTLGSGRISPVVTSVWPPVIYRGCLTSDGGSVMSLVTMNPEDSGEPLCHQDPRSPGVPGPEHPALLRAWPMGADWGDRNEMHQHQPRHLVLQLQTENLPNKRWVRIK